MHACDSSAPPYAQRATASHTLNAIVGYLTARFHAGYQSRCMPVMTIVCWTALMSSAGDGHHSHELKLGKNPTSRITRMAMLPTPMSTRLRRCNTTNHIIFSYCLRSTSAPCTSVCELPFLISMSLRLSALSIAIAMAVRA